VRAPAERFLQLYAVIAASIRLRTRQPQRALICDIRAGQKILLSGKSAVMARCKATGMSPRFPSIVLVPARDKPVKWTEDNS
jgi:hypothetical protein